MKVKEIIDVYRKIKSDIEFRLKEFQKLWLKGKEEDLFKELVFCLLTPQSKAEKCWEKVLVLESKGLLFSGSFEEIANELRGVRFRFNKACYIVEARKKVFIKKTFCIRQELTKYKKVQDAREHLIKSIKGLGYKEASHFLRNIGFSENVAILDRHILKSLKELGIIPDIPKSLSKKQYIGIEKEMKKFAESTNIPLSHLDFVLWYKETGRIFK